jgi:phosphate:Na+ symporter
MKEIIIAISGIILFLIGMLRLSSSVQSLINVRIKQYVKYIVEKPAYGLFAGIISTILFQSSSATTALTIGLVSAGLISFSNSLAIILGTDIGTTLTVQFVIWRFTEVSPFIISVGGFLWLINRGRWQAIGEMVFYFGLIFFGLELMSQAVTPLKNSPALLQLFTHAQNPFLGILIGIAITAVVHASAIPISVMVILAQQNLVSLENAIPVVMGANIGTTVTALLAGTVATKSGKRSAISHLIFKFVGIGLCFVFLPYFIIILKSLSSSVAQQIAFGHFFMNIVIVVTFIFLLGPFSSLMKKVLPGEDETLSILPEFINPADIFNPQKALDDVKNELKREINFVYKMFLKTIKMITCYQEGRQKDISYINVIVSNLRSQIVKFLWKVSAQDLSTGLSKKIFSYTAMANDIDSIGRHIGSISDLAVQKEHKKIKFSQCGENELQEIILLVRQNIEDDVSLIEEPNIEQKNKVVRREEEVDIKVKESRDNHLERFHKRLCDPEAGPIFVEMLLHFERISDLCENIAEYSCDAMENNF